MTKSMLNQVETTSLQEPLHRGVLSKQRTGFLVALTNQAQPPSPSTRRQGSKSDIPTDKIQTLIDNFFPNGTYITPELVYEKLAIKDGCNVSVSARAMPADYKEINNIPAHLCYAFAKDPDNNHPSGADCYQAGINQRREEEHQSVDEEELFSTMSEEQRTILQEVDCFVYLGVGDGTKFLKFLQGIYKTDSLDALKGVLKTRKSKLSIILKDISPDLLSRAKELLQSYSINVTCELGDFTESSVNSPNVYSTCYVSLGNTACNFDAVANIQQLQQSRQYGGRTFRYISTTLPKDNTQDMKQGYQEKRVENWLRETLRAAFGDTQAHLADLFTLDVNAHDSVQIGNQEQTHYFQPTRILVGVKLSDDAAKQYPDGLTIKLPTGDRSVIFYPGITYDIFVSNRYSISERKHILHTGGAYTHKQKTTYPVYNSKTGKQIYEKTKQIIQTTEKGKISLFTELQPLSQMSILENLFRRFYPPTMLFLTLVIIVGIQYRRSEDSYYTQYQKLEDQKKVELLDTFCQLPEDSLITFKQKIDAELQKIISKNYTPSYKERHETAQFLLNHVRDRIISSEDTAQASVLLHDLANYQLLTWQHKACIEQWVKNTLDHFSKKTPYAPCETVPQPTNSSITTTSPLPEQGAGQ